MLQIDRARQHRQPRLAGTIGAPAFLRAQRGAGRHIDDVATAALQHARQHRADRVIGTDQVDLDAARPRRGFARGDHADRLDDAGVVHQHIGRAEAQRGLMHQALAGVVVGDIAFHRQCLAARGIDPLRVRVGLLPAARRKHDRRTGLAQRECRGGADAAARTRYDCNLSGQTGHAVPPLEPVALWHTLAIGQARLPVSILGREEVPREGNGCRAA